MTPQSLLHEYEAGLGFRRGDVLVPKNGASPISYDVVNDTVVVISHNTLAPHTYLVIGERVNARSPSDKFVKFEINGHDWQRSSGILPKLIGTGFYRLPFVRLFRSRVGS